MIGAFVFWTFWETKCRYVLPYFLFIMPYSVIGYCNLLRQWKCKIVRASLGVIVALILLMNVSGFSIMNESMKINNDTEEYYEFPILNKRLQRPEECSAVSPAEF